MMMHNIIWLLLFLAVVDLTPAGITYEFSGGRFGDNLAAYSHAKWLSYKTGIPLYYRPFKYSDQLVLHYQEQHLDVHISSFSRQIVLTKDSMAMDASSNNLYIVPYFSESEYEFRYPWTKDWIYVRVEWEDQEFYRIMRSLIAPVQPFAIPMHMQPADAVSVALHVRKGGGFDYPLLSEAEVINPDIPYADYYAGLRFPPESFYVAQIRRLAALLGNQQLYIYLFTDHENPQELVDRFSKALADCGHIQFAYRARGNHHDANVIEDFFAMTRFDCAIHPQSHFSIMACKLGKPKIEISPTSFHWQSTRHVIDSISIVIKDSVPLTKEKYKNSIARHAQGDL